MLHVLGKIWTSILSLFELTSNEHEWHWIGAPGSPSWELQFGFDGFALSAVISPSFMRPANTGWFATFPCVDSIKVSPGRFYVPALRQATVLQQLLDAGMNRSHAERALRKLVKAEMQRTDDYDRGLLITYRMTVTIKRGRTCLSSEVVEGLNLDPAMLMLGGERHITDMAHGLKEQLRSEALVELKRLAHHQAMRLN